MRLSFCVACGDDNPDHLNNHHLVPRSVGGSDDESNLITLCRVCHGKIHGCEWSNNHRWLVKRGQREFRAWQKQIREQRAVEQKRRSEKKRKDGWLDIQQTLDLRKKFKLPLFAEEMHWDEFCVLSVAEQEQYISCAKKRFVEEQKRKARETNPKRKDRKVAKIGMFDALEEWQMIRD